MRKLNRLRKVGAVLGLLALLQGCAGLATHSCPAGLQPMVKAELYFGRAIPGGGMVSEADWQRFLDDEVTPRFPDGLTVQDAFGQWKGEGGIVREPSKRLVLVMSGSAGHGARLEAIRTAYRLRFRQESVLRVETPVCSSF